MFDGAMGRYPETRAAAWRSMVSSSTLLRMETRVSDFARGQTFHVDDLPVLTRHSGQFVPLIASDVPLICVVRNANACVRSFVRYYRGLGVTRFIFLDDDSNDGTRAFLETQFDVDVFTSALTFSEAESGKLWRDGLIELYGRGRWYLSVDADEFLVFPGSENRTVPAFIADLERQGLDRSLAPMLDLYPDGTLSTAVFVDDGTQWPFEISSHFDGNGYRIRKTRTGIKIGGGPRLRLFGVDNLLSKFPLLKVRTNRAMPYRRGGIHGPFPQIGNFAPVTAVLLHYKFTSMSSVQFAQFIAHGGHADGADEYRAVVASGRLRDDLSLMYPDSIRFKGSQDLVNRGFMIETRVIP